MLDIRVESIVLSDDGASSGSPPAGASWAAYVSKLIGEANQIYEDQQIGFRLRFDSATDLTLTKSTVLNKFQPTPLDLDPNGNDDNPHAEARQKECWKYPGKAVLIFRDYAPSEDQSSHSTGLYGDYVYFNKATALTGLTVAHELGHFFGLPHTHDKDNGVVTVNDAVKAIEKFVAKGNPIAKGLDVFDHDLNVVGDTPPDAGPTLFSTLNQAADAPPHAAPEGGYRCGTIGSVDLYTSVRPKPYTLAPDRSNFMSYFGPCLTIGGPKKPTISPNQKAVMEVAIETGQRNSLLHTAAMMDGSKAYFFQPGRYLRYDVTKDSADPDYPKSLDAGWPGLPWSHIDAAAVWPNGSTYLFHNDEYVKYDRENRRVFANYPQKIGAAWKGVWDRDLDAVLVLNEETAWFFKGSKCIKFDIPADKGEGIGSAREISERFAGVWSEGIDAALRWPNGKVYFFRGDRYVRYDLSASRTDQDVHQIRGNWPGLWPAIDAAVVWNDGTARFVKGGNYLAYDLLGDETKAGYPQPLARSDWNTWEGAFPFSGGFDAGSVWDKDTAYLFRGGQFVRFSLKDEKLDRGPRPISEEFDGVGNEELDAVVRWNNGKAYFFRDQHYIQVDVATKKAVSGKLDIGTFWKGIPSTRFDAVIALWNIRKAYFFKDGRYWRYDIAADRADDGYPMGINDGGWPGLAWA